MKVVMVAQGAGGASLESALIEAAMGGGYDRLDVAVAYATKQGVRTLEAALGGFPPESRWVVGLDDAITQPEALEYLLALPGAQLRVAALAPRRRFHPKLYCLSRSDNPAARTSAVGSGNMTFNGLRMNGEAAVLLFAESNEDAEALGQQWDALWSLGEAATEAVITTYTAAYKDAKIERKKIVDLGVAPPEPHPDETVPAVLDGNPQTAVHAWLDAGSATAQGREVELPRALVPFFGVCESTKSPIYLNLRHSSGKLDILPMTMREDNSMWRIGFTQSAINEGAGRKSLRPILGGNRSDLAIVFKRTDGGEFHISFTEIDSLKYDDLIVKSKEAGALFRTMKGVSGRNFGFF